MDDKPTLTANLERGVETQVLRTMQDRGITPEMWRQIGSFPRPGRNLIADQIAEVIRRHCGMIFLSRYDQLESFRRYNNWLQTISPEHVIPFSEFVPIQERLGEIPDHSLLFYCHSGDVILTSYLALQYAFSTRKKFASGSIGTLQLRKMEPAPLTPPRPNGFYWMRIPFEDEQAIGKKFQRFNIKEARELLGENWSMGCEGFQFVSITHPHYPELIDGEKYPWIALPGLYSSPSSASPIIHLDEFGDLCITLQSIVSSSEKIGAGTLKLIQ